MRTKPSVVVLEMRRLGFDLSKLAREALFKEEKAKHTLSILIRDWPKEEKNDLILDPCLLSH